MPPTFVITLPVLWGPGMAITYTVYVLLMLYALYRFVTGFLDLL